MCITPAVRHCHAHAAIVTMMRAVNRRLDEWVSESRLREIAPQDRRPEDEEIDDKVELGDKSCSDRVVSSHDLNRA